MPSHDLASRRLEQPVAKSRTALVKCRGTARRALLLALPQHVGVPNDPVEELYLHRGLLELDRYVLPGGRDGIERPSALPALLFVRGARLPAGSVGLRADVG